MSVLPANSVNIEYAAKLLREGRTVAFPTETVYGLGADVFNVDALACVFEIKRRPRFDPLIVHIASMVTLDVLVDFSALSALAKERLALLAGRFWPGPLTIVLPKISCVPDLATAGLGTVAVRFPDNPVALELIRRLGTEGAVAAPSANPFGYLSPTRAGHVAAQLGDLVPLILDGGPCRIGVESTVLDIGGGTAGERPRILRPGGVTQEMLRTVIPDIEVSAKETPLEELAARSSPGLAKSHYAPSTPLCLHSRSEMRSLSALPGHACLYMEGTPQKYAALLFEKLRALDTQGYVAIHAELAPEEGIGIAINDRLRRAAAKIW
ncbi:MAG: threonylcarbamoyl-AMP synthase [Spirochaetaceae bacterium]|nr:threonylcarbamoyl-AMP synthase [Spirochaetaceae bacterium]